MDWKLYNAGRNRGMSESVRTEKKKRPPAVSCANCENANVYRMNSEEGIEVVACSISHIYLSKEMAEVMEVHCSDYQKGKPVDAEEIIKIELP